MVELCIVCALMGIMAAIAVPRMSSAAENSRGLALRSSMAQLQRCVDYYSAEHADRSPATDPDGTPTTSGITLAQRLMRKTDDIGTVKAAGIFGPYMQVWPVNPFNGRATIRIDGVAAGADLSGWRFDSLTMKIEADHSAGGANVAIATVSAGKPGSVAAAEAMGE